MNRVVCTSGFVLSLLWSAWAGVLPARAQWTQTSGPGIAIVHTVIAGAQLLAGTTGSGVFRSTDHGATWLATTGLENAMIECFAANGTFVFAGLNNFNGIGGVFRTSDGGRTWQAASSGLGPRWIPCLLADGSTIYAGTYGNGIFKSTNNGDTWSPSNAGMETEMVGAIVRNGTRLFASGSNFLYQSTNNGASWEFTDGGQYFQISSMYSDGNNIYAGGIQGLIRSTDAGATWSDRIDILFMRELSRLTSFVKLGVTLYASGSSSPGSGGDGVLKSTDAGLTWAPARTGIEIVAVHALALDGGNLVGAAPDKGILVSTDAGATWARRTAGFPPGGNIRRLAGSGNAMYAGTQGDGVYRTTDDGLTWIQKSADPTGFLRNETILALHQSGALLLAGTAWHGLYRSVDGGENWLPEGDGFEIPNLQVIDVAPTTTKLIGGTGEGIYHSSDQGDSWVLSNVPQGTITAVAGSASFGYANVVTGLFQSNGVYRSTNNGQTWNVVFQGIDASYIATMAAEGSFVYAGMFTGGLIRSTDNGASWQDRSPEAGIGIFTIFRLLNDVYAGSDADGAGVYHSTNHGSSWTAFGEGLPSDAPVEAFGATTSFLFAGTEEDGVWRRIRTGNTGAGDGSGPDVPVSLWLGGVVPNPVSDRGVIRFAMPAAGPARLRLIDVAGRERSIVLDGVVAAGPHSLEWSPGGLETGVYFLKLEAAERAMTTKVLVAR